MTLEPTAAAHSREAKHPSLAVSFEVFPPVLGAAEERFWRAVDRLAPLGPGFFSVTYGAGGSTRDRSERIVRGLLARGDTVPAAHLTCVGASRNAVDQIAHAWAAAGVTRVVALRGDMPTVGAPFQSHPEGYRDAADLIAGLRRVADFDIAAAAYPETHPDSMSLQADLDNLKRKTDAGASKLITQYFFDAETFLRFRDRTVKAGITVPIIPGILPITNFSKILAFSRRCGATVPTWLAERFQGLDLEPQMRATVAVTTACQLCRELIAEGVEALHFYTLNQAALTYTICRKLDVQRLYMEAA
jgi:methylenetetrahydrofolate reductase (NADPH)